MPLERADGAIGIPNWGRTFWPLFILALAKVFLGDLGAEINFLLGDGTLSCKVSWDF